MPAWSPVQDLPLAPVRFTGPTADHFRAILNPRNLVLLQPAREQFAAPFEDRIGGGRKVSVDPFQIPHAEDFLPFSQANQRAFSTSI